MLKLDQTNSEKRNKCSLKFEFYDLFCVLMMSSCTTKTYSLTNKCIPMMIVNYDLYQELYVDLTGMLADVLGLEPSQWMRQR